MFYKFIKIQIKYLNELKMKLVCKIRYKLYHIYNIIILYIEMVFEIVICMSKYRELNKCANKLVKCYIIWKIVPNYIT